MASQLKALEVTFPYKGVVSDPPPSETGEGTASVIENAIVTPTEIRPRLGMVRGRHYGSDALANYMQPHAAVTVNGVTGLIVGSRGSTKYVDGGGSDVTPKAVESTPPLHGFEPSVPYYGTPSASIGDTPVLVRFAPGAWSPSNYFKVYSAAAPSEYGMLTDTRRYDARRFTVFQDAAWWTDGIALYAWAGADTALNTRYTKTISSVDGPNRVTFDDTELVGDYTNYLMVPTNSGSPAGVNNAYIYRIMVSGGVGPTSVEAYLDTPYGAGNPAVPAMTVGATFKVTPVASVLINSMGATNTGLYMRDLTCIEAWRGRLFVASDNLAGALDTGDDTGTSGIAWSYPNNGARWPTSNYAVFSEFDGRRITALAATARGLLVFTTSDVGILTGFDEASFQFHILSSDVGCVSPTSVTSHGGTAYWEAADGLYRSDGSSIQAISTEVRAAMRKYDYTVTRLTEEVEPRVTVFENRLYYTRVSESTSYRDINTVPPVWVYDIGGGGWSTMAAREPHMTPVLMHVVGRRLYGFTYQNVADCTDCYRPRHRWTSTVAGDCDSGYAPRSTTALDAPIRATVTFTVRPGGRDTVRLREAEVHHATYYGGLVSEPRDGWYMDVTPDYSTQATTNTIRSRWVANAPLYDPSLYYSDKLTNVADGEGTVFRVTLRTNTVQQFTANHFSRRIMGVRIYFDPSATHTGRVNTDPIY